MQILTFGLLVFFLINLVNVMLSTSKSILTIKSTRAIAAIMNALAYGFYAMVVKSMANFETHIVVVTVVIANLIGVYVSIYMLEKLKKDKLWKITVIILEENYSKIRDELINLDIGFNKYYINTKKGECIGLDIFSENQKQSLAIKNILKDYKVKYHVLEIAKSL